MPDVRDVRPEALLADSVRSSVREGLKAAWDDGNAEFNAFADEAD